MPVDLNLYCDNSKEWTYTTTVDITSCPGVTTLEYRPNDIKYGTVLNDWSPTKHFNCKRCGAPNQIDICEYCGSAAEE